MVDGVLVDTSVWIDHLRQRSARLVALLESNQVHVHPFVIGELACGNLSRRSTILSALSALPKAPRVDDAAVLSVLDSWKLMGRGLGWVDVCLLASAAEGNLRLWSTDRRLAHTAAQHHIAFK